MLAAGILSRPGSGAMGRERRGAVRSAGQSTTITTMKKKTMRNFLDALVAVLAGNAIYYLVMPHLPAVARHRLFQEDWGLLVDFAICSVIFAGVKHYARRDVE